MRSYLLVSGCVFSLVAIAHLIRGLMTLPVLIDGVTVPMAVSWVGFAVTAALAAWGFRNLSRSDEPSLR